MKIFEKFFYLYLVLGISTSILKKSLNHENHSKKKRHLELFPDVERESKTLTLSNENQHKYLNDLTSMLSNLNVQTKIEQLNQDDLEFFEEKKEDILKKIGGVKSQLNQQLGEFYTKYIQLPMMGNYSYWDLTNPASLH